jgi:hypothetical protein
MRWEVESAKSKNAGLAIYQLWLACNSIIMFRFALWRRINSARKTA